MLQGFILVSVPGFEPGTLCLKGRCSTTELHPDGLGARDGRCGVDRSRSTSLPDRGAGDGVREESEGSEGSDQATERQRVQTAPALASRHHDSGGPSGPPHEVRIRGRAAAPLSRFIASSLRRYVASLPHMLNHRITELRALHLLGTVDLPSQIIGYPTCFDGCLNGIAHCGTCRFPSHIIKHHGTREDH